MLAIFSNAHTTNTYSSAEQQENVIHIEINLTEPIHYKNFAGALEVLQAKFI